MKRLLVIHTWGIGDWIFFTPALRLLRETYPDLEVDVLVGTPGTAPILRYSDNVRIFGIADVRKSSWRVLALLLRNCSRHYDVALFTAGIDTTKADLLAPFIRADEIAALTTHDHRPRFIHKFRRYEEHAHRASNNIVLVSLLGTAIDRDPIPHLTAKDLPSAEPGTVLLHPGCDSANPYKRWPAPRFAAVADNLLMRGHWVSVILGPAERDLVGDFRELVSRPRFKLYMDQSFDNAVKVVAAHDVLLHSDSGLGHVAAALGRGCVGIIGPADPIATRPLGTRVKILRNSPLLPCQPCMRQGGQYGCQARPCLDAVSTSMVTDEVETALGLVT